MRKLRICACLLGLVLLVPLLLHARQILPMDTRPLVAEKYAGWSGVLRLWVFEGWPCGTGSVSPWLNRCVALFEKRHPGVYVQPRAVDEGAIASLNDSGILPPDMILFPPDLLKSPEGLLPIDLPGPLRPALSGCGLWDGRLYAVPVAMGGYAWAWNTGLLERIPNTWRETDATLAVPPPERWRRWDAALLALCSGQYRESAAEEGPTAENSPSHGVDLGLTESATPVPTVAPPADGDALPRRLPVDFRFDEDAWRRFINGDIAAIPVTQREVRRLQALSEQGKGPDWRLTPGDAPFSDQLLSLAVVDRENAESQQALCLAFLSLLLSDECQGDLHTVSAFSVTGTPSGYSAGDPLASMDDFLRSDSLRTPNSFDPDWTTAAESIVREFMSGAREAPELWRRLGNRLVQNPNY